MAKKKLAKRPVKKIPQPKFPKDWGKIKTDVSSVEVNATCTHPFAVARPIPAENDFTAALRNHFARPIRDTAADIQALVARVDGLVARWEEITTQVEAVCDYMEKILRKAK